MFIRQQRCLSSRQQKYHAHHRLRYRPKVPAGLTLKYWVGEERRIFGYSGTGASRAA